MSLPGLVSQRQCKVTARRTRASRYRHVCNGPQPPFPAQRPAPYPPRPRPISAVCQYVSPSSPMQRPPWPQQHSDALHIFLCSAPAPFTTHATAAITAYSPPLRRPQKNNLSYRQRHRALQRFVGKSVNWLLLNIPT